MNPVLLLKNSTPARYTPAGGGRVLYVRNDNLYAQRFNRGSRKLEGEPELLLQGVSSGVRGNFSVARNGTVAWRPGTAAYSQVTEFDRAGNVIGTSGPKVMMTSILLSPDEKQILATGYPFGFGALLEIGQGGRLDIPKGPYWIGWLGGRSEIAGTRNGKLVAVRGSGSGEVREIRSLGTDSRPSSVSPDGAIFGGLIGGEEAWAARVEGTPDEVRPVVIDKSGLHTALRFSPDSRWALYGVYGAGGGLYIQAFPGPGPRRQIASAVTPGPIWRGDGKEILYRDGDALMSIKVEASETLTFGVPRKLFSGLRPSGGASPSTPLAVSRDGSRIFWAQAVEQPEANIFHVKIGAVR